jgi:hypothetical protein
MIEGGPRELYDGKHLFLQVGTHFFQNSSHIQVSTVFHQIAKSKKQKTTYQVEVYYEEDCSCR